MIDPIVTSFYVRWLHDAIRTTPGSAFRVFFLRCILRWRLRG